ncbi:MAG: Ig-like domain repeat protein [Candidatus Bathyarchaeota archaeon]|nr:MAG: Ig-like domain repeat protein [Candidatus Bathyarchaeota archaeon]
MENTLAGRKRRLMALVTLVLAASASTSLNISVKAQNFPEYQKYVHTYLNSQVFGNLTYMEKPMFPVFLNDSQVQIGKNWSVASPLRANHSYHVYFYGDWIDRDLEPKTDYDIYAYNPSGEMEGYHTESAGLPEHLGTTANKPFFVPKYSGNYTFVIRNDPRESNSSQQATFMIIEDVETNVWHEHYVEGKEDNLSVLETSWAYDFVTESQDIEVWIKVPGTLDMYEARLYLMANPQASAGSILNEVPLAWESGLYGEKNGMFGGYNLESKEYRGVAYSSCEFYGQDMFMNFTSPYSGKSLYHLVFIGEIGSGTIEFMIKTEFENAYLKPSVAPKKVYPDNNTTIAYSSNATTLENATLQYSTNGWKNATNLEMEIVNNRTCKATIPGQAAGTSISYRIEASDTLENVLAANGSYSVKYPSTLNISLTRDSISPNKNITVRGYLTPPAENVSITVYFTSTNKSKQALSRTDANGTFTATLKLETVGTWKVQANFSGDNYRYGNVSKQLTVQVKEPSILEKYFLYIGGGISAVAVIGVVIYLKKFRE